MTSTTLVDYSELIEFEHDLSATARNLSDDSRALLETADAIAAAARGKVPVLRGRLISSITSRSMGSYALVSAGGGLEYGAVQEFGWAAHGIEGSHYVWGSLGHVPEEKFWEGVTSLLRRAFPFFR